MNESQFDNGRFWDCPSCRGTGLDRVDRGTCIECGGTGKRGKK